MLQHEDHPKVWSQRDLPTSLQFPLDARGLHALIEHLAVDPLHIVPDFAVLQELSLIDNKNV